jgi:rhodanese-related sulfurtransferase
MFALLYGLKSISPNALATKLGDDTLRVFDLNGSGRWEAAHVPGATHLAPDFSIADLPTDRSTALVFYCSNPLCRKAPDAARRARQMGFQDVRVMSAGISGWIAAGHRTEPSTVH